MMTQCRIQKTQKNLPPTVKRCARLHLNGAMGNGCKGGRCLKKRLKKCEQLKLPSAPIRLNPKGVQSEQRPLAMANGWRDDHVTRRCERRLWPERVRPTAKSTGKGQRLRLRHAENPTGNAGLMSRENHNARSTTLITDTPIGEKRFLPGMSSPARSVGGKAGNSRPTTSNDGQLTLNSVSRFRMGSPSTRESAIQRRTKCLEVGTCVERREAFQLAGVPDPTHYAEA